jgi:hypothetical protein
VVLRDVYTVYGPAGGQKVNFSVKFAKDADKKVWALFQSTKLTHCGLYSFCVSRQKGKTGSEE